MVYQPGKSVARQTVVRRERWPGSYKNGVLTRIVPLVYAGQELRPDQPIQRIEPRVKSSTATRDEVVPAGMYGRAVDVTPRGGIVVEGSAALVHGEVGAGHQVAGVLQVVQEDTQNQQLPPGAILVVPGTLTFTMLRQALLAGVVGVVGGSIAAKDFEGFLNADLVQIFNDIDIEHAQANLPQLTVMCTEGLGAGIMDDVVMMELRQHQGAIVLLSGITSPRWGVWPELLISLSPEEMQENRQQLIQQNSALVLGARARVSGGEHEGATGTIEYFFSYEQIFPSGIQSRALLLRLDNGIARIIPISQAQRIG
jgi:hypothetical protein